MANATITCGVERSVTRSGGWTCWPQILLKLLDGLNDTGDEIAKDSVKGNVLPGGIVEELAVANQQRALLLDAGIARRQLLWASGRHSIDGDSLLCPKLHRTS